MLGHRAIFDSERLSVILEVLGRVERHGIHIAKDFKKQAGLRAQIGELLLLGRCTLQEALVFGSCVLLRLHLGIRIQACRVCVSKEVPEGGQARCQFVQPVQALLCDFELLFLGFLLRLFLTKLCLGIAEGKAGALICIRGVSMLPNQRIMRFR